MRITKLKTYDIILEPLDSLLDSVGYEIIVHKTRFNIIDEQGKLKYKSNTTLRHLINGLNKDFKYTKHVTPEIRDKYNLVDIKKFKLYINNKYNSDMFYYKRFEDICALLHTYKYKDYSNLLKTICDRGYKEHMIDTFYHEDGYDLIDILPLKVYGNKYNIAVLKYKDEYYGMEVSYLCTH